MFVPIHSARADSGYGIVHRFGGGSEGAYPYGAVIADAAGNLYGTTYEGGGTGCYDGGGCGTVFKLKPDGREKVLHAFRGNGDGAYPMAGLIMDEAGNLYGTTSQGGGTACDGTYGCGTVFKITPKGKETVLYAFCQSNPACPDGSTPYAGLVIDRKGNLYGTTVTGGNAPDCGYSNGCGTVFRIASDGTETILYNFCHGHYCPDGALPESGLLRDNAGNLYGTASEGGDTNCPEEVVLGCGVVFELSPAGQLTVLHAFSGYPDGSTPVAGLTRDGHGNFYGTTDLGGSGDACPSDYGCGSVFKLAADGTETVLYGFEGGSDGNAPIGGVALDRKQNVFGTTYMGGNTGCNQDEGCGVVFKLSPSGRETVLHTFSYPGDGANPYAGLIRVGRFFYGTTEYGAGSGTIFRITR